MSGIIAPLSPFPVSIMSMHDRSRLQAVFYLGSTDPRAVHMIFRTCAHFSPQACSILFFIHLHRSFYFSHPHLTKKSTSFSITLILLPFPSVILGEYINKQTIHSELNGVVWYDSDQVCAHASEIRSNSLFFPHRLPAIQRVLV